MRERLDKAIEEIVRLRAKIQKYESKTKDGYFGSSTPSSKIPFKENSESNNNGGAKVGHKGNGRGAIKEEEADRVEYHTISGDCPDCGGRLIKRRVKDRSIIDLDKVAVKRELHKCTEYECERCRKRFKAKPAVLERSLYGNNLISQMAVFHYLEGISGGRLESILGKEVVLGSLFEAFHRVASIFEPSVKKVVEDFKRSEVRHADETSWRTDGHSGYAWIFCSKEETVFKFEDTRSSKVPFEIFGNEKLGGYLVVDRYNGYNKVPCKIQYCYAHLLRSVEDLGKEFIDNEEVSNFVNAFIPLLSKAMHLRNEKISDEEYYKEAQKLKREIETVVNAPSNHMGIKNIQQIFLDNKERLYHWVENRKVPPDNNRAERELRPSVIARKVSFGSGSKKGAQTRATIMTVLHTAKKRLKSGSVSDWLKGALDKISTNPSLDPYSLLPPIN